jgi:5-oxoprolinase (ATP-hydrolysing)
MNRQLPVHLVKTNIHYLSTRINMTKKWNIWIDTGGTFTDCIGYSPDGYIKRAKVLSSGNIRAQLVEKAAPRCFKIAHSWPVDQDIFEGYSFRFLQENEESPQSLFIQKTDIARNLIWLNRDIPFDQPTDFELTAFEEAPVLGARMITQSPLKEKLPPMELRLGSTKGTNALLERKGAKVALLITQGFQDLLYIGNQQRPHLFQLDIPEPPILTHTVIEVAERMDAAGRVLHPLEKKEVQPIIDQLRQVEVDAIAVSFMHAYKNPEHELLIKTQLEEAGFQYISLSHELSPSIKFVPRTQTAVVNAYLTPIIEAYLDNIRKHLSDEADQSMLVMTSAGGLIHAAQFNAKDSLLSGPAGGVVGASIIARQHQQEHILTFDMGGTSTDTARYDGQYDYEYISNIDRIEMLSPTLSIETVAAGGGSICYFKHGKLQVGPESSGAFPGPACYGAGGPLSITDINLLLGKMDPSSMGIPIDLEASRQAAMTLIEEIEEETGERYSLQDLTTGLERIANEKMAEAIRRISVSKGFDPSDYAIVAFGGAGGQHCCKIAEILHTPKVIVPFDGGLLSAYGIGNARVERMAERQILQPLSDYQGELPFTIGELASQSIDELMKAGYSTHHIKVLTQFIYLRLQGQENTIEIDWMKTDDLEKTFEEKYQQLFGYYPEQTIIEVESIKVTSGTRQSDIQAFSPIKNNTPAPLEHVLNPVAGKEKEIPVYRWADLEPGMEVQGPALLLNDHATVYLEKDWLATFCPNKDLQLNYHPQQTEEEAKTYKEAVEIELFTNRFMAIAEEMGAQLQRTAFSVNVKERLDFSCALLTPDAELLVNAPHIPVHLGSLGICTRLVRERLPFRPGDVIITNHPKFGGSHLPDITLISGVFTEEGELIGYVANRAHHAEVGGKRPGSMPPDARTLSEEGVAFLPMYAIDQGQTEWGMLREQLEKAPYPSRAIEANLADINAALASLRSGEQALKKLVQQHGLEKVQYYMGQIKQVSADAIQRILQQHNGAVFSAKESLDDGHEICVEIRIQDGRIKFDFEGTSGPHPYNLNANISIVYSAVIYILRLWCRQNIPLNEGLMEKVDIVLPNSFLHPSFADDPEKCPAVVGGNTEVSQRLVDTLIKALGLAACSQGTMNNLLFGNDAFGYYETICGGVGAGPGFDGRSGVHQHMTNTRITDPEEMERKFPVRLNHFGLRPGSGGAGKWRGGDGIIREIEFLEDLELTILSQHRVVAPFGMEGGEAGKVGEQYLVKTDGQKEKLQGVDSRTVRKGEKILVKTPGGGGWDRNE